MKRRELIKRLEKNGYVLKRHINNHDIYWNEKNKKTVPVEKHREINNVLANVILEEAGL